MGTQKEISLSWEEEQTLVRIGREDHVFAGDDHPALATFYLLKKKGLAYRFDRPGPGGTFPVCQAWSLTSEGSFIFKQLERGKSYQQQKGAQQ